VRDFCSFVPKFPEEGTTGAEIFSSLILVMNRILLDAFVILYQLKETRLMTQKIVNMG